MSAFPGGNLSGYAYFPPYYPMPNPKPAPILLNTAGRAIGQIPQGTAYYLPIAQAAPYLDTWQNVSAQPVNPTQGFSVLRAARETVKGVFRPITTLVRHPFKSVFTLGATVALASAAPITIPLMVLGGLGFGGLQTARGIWLARQEYVSGNYAAAEKAFGDIGEGAFSIASSLLGVRSAGTITAEAKASRLALKASTPAAERLKSIERGLKAAETVQGSSWFNAFSETCSVLSPEGVKTLGTQLNPIRLFTLAKGKTESFIALWRESPTVDLNAAIRKAQAYLGIRDADMPRIVPELKITLPSGKEIDKSRIANGFYQGETHTLHIQPDRLKALKGILAIPDSFKRFAPFQRFWGNAHKRRIDIEGLAVHELTHARQWNEIRQLSMAQARQTIRQAYPSRSETSIQAVLEAQRFDGLGANAASLEAARENLRQLAKFKFAVEDLQAACKENPGVLNKFRAGRDSFHEYVRSDLEIEARQNAAEAMVAASKDRLKQAANLAESERILSQAREQMIEAKLNKLMRQINRLEQQGQAQLAAARQREMERLANLQRTPTITHKYLLKEVRQQDGVRNLEAMINWGRPFGLPREEPKTLPWYTAVACAVSRVFRGILRFFTPSGLQQYSQGKQALRPTYLTINQAVNDPQAVYASV